MSMRVTDVCSSHKNTGLQGRCKQVSIAKITTRHCGTMAACCKALATHWDCVKPAIVALKCAIMLRWFVLYTPPSPPNNSFLACQTFSRGRRGHQQQGLKVEGSRGHSIWCSLLLRKVYVCSSAIRYMLLEGVVFAVEKQRIFVVKCPRACG